MDVIITVLLLTLTFPSCSHSEWGDRRVPGD